MAWNDPRTWVAGEKPPAATLNAHIRDNFKALGDAWAPYTPVAGGGLTLGNGTLTGSTMQAGKLTTVNIEFTFGSTSAIASNITFTLPVTAAGDAALAAWLTDASGGAGGRLVGVGAILAGAPTTMQVYGPGGSFTSTVPFTWATGDRIVVTGTYEAA